MSLQHFIAGDWGTSNLRLYLCTIDGESRAQLVETRFGPGIVRIIEPNPLPEETFSGPLPLQKFLAAHPEIEWTEHPNNTPYFNSRSRTLIEKAKQVILRREIHGVRG